MEVGDLLFPMEEIVSDAMSNKQERVHYFLRFIRSIVENLVDEVTVLCILHLEGI